jgi:hypothetical protein
MAITKEPAINAGKRPILLKGTSRSLCLEMIIGDLGLELWDFPNEEAQPYARLIFDRDGKDGKEGAVTLNWQECCALSGAIQEWLSFLKSGEEHHEPALHMELASRALDFCRSGFSGRPRMVCAVERENGSSRQVVLTCSETSLLGRLLFCEEE